jgi:hypothetical protein
MGRRRNRDTVISRLGKEVKKFRVVGGNVKLVAVSRFNNLKLDESEKNA